ncbi:MAG: Oxidoreductase [Gemmataceae bacterium]|nr:Oxidoreductase [Gemmataceae bacterium]
MARPYRVGVVGAGVGGAASAYLLARDGHQVTLLERAEFLGPVGAGVLLQCSGQDVLRRLGILEKVTARAAPIEALYARHVSGGDLIRTRYADLEPGCRAYGIHRGVLFGALMDLVRTLPVDVRLGCDVTGREVTVDGVSLTDKAGRRHGPFDFVIAADGSRSRMRGVCGLRAVVTEYTHGTLWVTAPCHAVRDHLLQVVRGNRKLFGLLPLGGGLCSMYWGFPVAEFPQLAARGLGALKAEILAFSPEAAEVLDFLRDFDQLILTGYRHVHLRRWSDDRTAFIGDAAHAMSPHLGQGINLALVDAWRLAACLREESTPAAAFRAFRRRQRAYIRYYAAVTYLLSPFFQSDWSVLAWGRDVVLPWLPRVSWVRRQMLLTVAGLKGGFLKGRIEV